MDPRDVTPDAHVFLIPTPLARLYLYLPKGYQNQYQPARLHQFLECIFVLFEFIPNTLSIINSIQSVVLDTVN